MKISFNRGFSIIEMLVVLILFSTMLTIFAPIITKNVKKQYKPGCVGGVKTMIAEYKNPGEYLFYEPKILGMAHIFLVGGGGAGANASILYDMNKNFIGYQSGGGGGGGQCIKFDAILYPELKYTIKVGHGRTISYEIQGMNYTASSISTEHSKIHIIGTKEQDNVKLYTNVVRAEGGFSASSGFGGKGGVSLGSTIKGVWFANGQDGEGGSVNGRAGSGGSNIVFFENQKGGAAGNVCMQGSCNPHGKPGSGYRENSASDTGFVAGAGGGGGGFDGATKTTGKGGDGGDGYVRIEYQVRCD